MVVSISSSLESGKFLAGVVERMMVHSLLFFVRSFALHRKGITFFFKHLTEVAPTAQIKARICKAMKITMMKGDEISLSARRTV